MSLSRRRFSASGRPYAVVCLEPRTQRTETSDHVIKQAARGGGIALAGNLIDKGLRFPLEMLPARVLGAGDDGSYSLGYVSFSFTKSIKEYKNVNVYGSLLNGDQIICKTSLKALSENSGNLIEPFLPGML